MGRVRAMLFAGATTLLSIPAASAADLAPVMPLRPPVIQEFSGWYLRGDIGFSNQKLGNLDNVAMHAAGTTVTLADNSFDGAPFFGLGLGYRLNDWLRFDVTGEYRAQANFHGRGTSTDTSGGSPVYGVDTYSASKSEWTGLVNAYLDLGTWWHITPFIGAGVGASYNTISNFVDSGLFTPGCGSTCSSNWYAPNAGTWNLAWALHAGLAYQVTPAFTVELAYRYLDLGKAKTGNAYTFDAAYMASYGPGHPFYFNNITSNDVKLGLRWMFGPEPVYAPPLITKG